MNGRNLNLGLNIGDKLIVYRNDDEATQLQVTFKGFRNNQAVLLFNGDEFSVWREAIYERGQMRKDSSR